eukprot:scaffold210859_cov27-Tisochrysis_lutea.AAC.1
MHLGQHVRKTLRALPHIRVAYRPINHEYGAARVSTRLHSCRKRAHFSRRKLSFPIEQEEQVSVDLLEGMRASLGSEYLAHLKPQPKAAQVSPPLLKPLVNLLSFSSNECQPQFELCGLARGRWPRVSAPPGGTCTKSRAVPREKRRSLRQEATRSQSRARLHHLSECEGAGVRRRDRRSGRRRGERRADRAPPPSAGAAHEEGRPRRPLAWRERGGGGRAGGSRRRKRRVRRCEGSRDGEARREKRKRERVKKKRWESAHTGPTPDGAVRLTSSVEKENACQKSMSHGPSYYLLLTTTS